MIGCIILGVILVISYLVYVKVGSTKSNTMMSFRESLDLVGIPIVTFRQGNEKYNFLLDTGSSQSMIHSGYVGKVNSSMSSDNTADYYGVDGVKKIASRVALELEYKGKKYEHTYLVGDLELVLSNIKTDYGITMVGILGSDFLEKYKYILDFKELVAYQQK